MPGAEKNSELAQKWPLHEQCAALQIPLCEAFVERRGKHWIVGGQAHRRPEEAALSLLNIENWQGVNCEGGSILIAMKSAGFNWVLRNNYQNDPNDAVTRFLEAAITISNDKTESFVEEIRYCTVKTFLKNISHIYNNEFIRGCYPGTSEYFMCELFSCWKEKLVEIAEIFVTAPYDYRAGWPDLCVIRQGKVRFVEVKTSDKLHQSQLRLISDILQPLDIDVSVLRLKPKPGHS